MKERTNQHFQDLDKNYYLQTFRRFPITLERGQGTRVWDVEQNEYLDALGGIAVSSLGHAHPALVQAIHEQAEKLLHISNFYLSEPQALLAKRLTELSGLDRVFFSNSGAESVEGAIKIARKYAHRKGRGGKVISFEGSFHGRTLATIATGKKQMQNGFEPIPEGFQQIPMNMEAVRKAAGKETAAFIIEPIQGEGGINVVSEQLMHELHRFCRQEDILLIFDEIQCGMGRTGKLFAKDHFGIQPDIITLAKALGGGVPIGAILSCQKASDAITFGDHGTTFGGNPLACAAALAVLDTLEKENLIQQTHEKGEWLMAQLRGLNSPHIKEVRGKGLMIGVAFDQETKPLVQLLFEKGILANATAGNILRLVPPLIISYEDMHLLVNKIQEAINEL